MAAWEISPKSTPLLVSPTRRQQMGQYLKAARGMALSRGGLRLLNIFK